jgi:hypothetical protein
MQQTSVFAAQPKIAPMKQTAASAKAKIFFPNLDGLRFVSFFVVFLYHSLLSILSYLKDASPAVYNVVNFLFKAWQSRSELLFCAEWISHHLPFDKGKGI